MNYTESFEQFASRLTPTDLALYAGVGLVLWVLFKDKLGGVQKIVSGILDKVKSTSSNTIKLPVVDVPKVNPVSLPKAVEATGKDDIFFKLVVSWKQTRDLAEKSGCSEAVKVADQMFPYLSPNVCNKTEV